MTVQHVEDDVLGGRMGVCVVQFYFQYIASMPFCKLVDLTMPPLAEAFSRRDEMSFR
jgi:hypothetical protein